MRISGLVFGAAIMFGAAPAQAFEPPLFPLSDAQVKALKSYETAKGAKAFAASAGGATGVRSGYVSAAAAARDALIECDQTATAPAERCILIDLNGAPVPLALQLAQQSRLDPEALKRPVPLGDLSLDAEGWQAAENLKTKSGHKAFAVSLKGPWARAWEAASAGEAERQALDTCNKKEKAAGAPCFLLILDDVPVPPTQLSAHPDLTVTLNSGSTPDR